MQRAAASRGVLTALVGLLLIASRCSGAALSTPWATLELTDKDRAISRQPWLTYASSSVVGFHSTSAPLSAAAALDPAHYQISQGTGAPLPIAETSYRSRLLFLSLRPTINHPDPVAWGHHVFLQLAAPLAAGSYNLTVAAAAWGQEVTLSLVVDEDKTLNEAIHVNQVGYPLDGPKRAIVGAYLGSSTAADPYKPSTLRLPGGDGSPFFVLDAASGAQVFAGTARVFGDGVVHEYFKQVAYHLDFSALTTPGRYVIRVPGLGVSHAFRVSDDALRPALGAVARTFYGQRCGVALDTAYLSPWERPEACHADDAEVLEVSPPPTWFQSKFPLPNSATTTTLPLNPQTNSYFFPQPPGGTRLQVVGGHHDAGDYGKYVINSGTLVGWLMASLEVLGADNDDLPLPEAGDGIPDIVQIVEHELKFLEGMQDTDGGVFCVVKPNSTAGEYYEHHLPCGTPSKDTCNFAPNSPLRGRRIAWPKDTPCTAQFAGALARVARSPWFKTFRPADAARYLQKAVKAWEFLETKAPFGALCYHFYGCIGGMEPASASPPPWHNTYSCYDPQNDQSHDERLWAAVELYAATGEAKYHDYFLQRHCPRYRRWGWQMLPFSYGLATVTYAQLAVQANLSSNFNADSNANGTTLQINADMAAKCVAELAEVGKGYTNQAQASPYFLAITERSSAIYGYGWIFQASTAAQLLFAAQLAAKDPTEAALWCVASWLACMYLCLSRSVQEAGNLRHPSNSYTRLLSETACAAATVRLYEACLEPCKEGLLLSVKCRRDMAGMQLHFIMGTNPQGFSLITGLGARRITNPVDDESVYDEWDAPWPGQLVGLSGGFSWLNEYGAAVGKTFPPGNAYGIFDRITDAFNVNTEYTVPEMALALGALAVLTGKSTSPLPPKPTLSVQLSVSSGPAPLTVSFGLTVSGSPADIATVEFDFGDGGHSYQAAPQHTYLDPGRVFTGFATVVDRRGQAVTQKLTVTTAFSTNTALPPPAELQLVAQVNHAAGSASTVPPLLAVAAPLTPGTNASLSLSVPAVLAAGMSASTDNLAWQGPKDTWTGAALRPQRYEDNATFDIAAASPAALQAILSAASGGLVLDFWVYVDRFLTYGRDNMPMVALLGRDKTLFGLQGSKWAGNQLVAGDLGVVANETHLKPALTPGRWHSVRLAVLASSNATGQCSAFVDGQVVAQRNCQLSRLLNFCATKDQALRLVVGTFDGYVDGVRLYASPEGTTTELCGPRPPPPAPPAPPPPLPPVQVFSPYTITQATLALMDADSACGLSGSAVNATLPLRLFRYGQPTSTNLLPFKTSYTAGLSTSANGSSTWGADPAGCSLRVESDGADGGGNAVVTWRLSQSQLQHAVYTKSLTVEAKVFVERWGVGYSKWNSDVLGVFNNWDTFFKFTTDLWKGPALLLSTPAAATTGAFAGTLANASVVQSVISPGTWHHVALLANSTTCVLSVDGAEVVAGRCSADKLLWQPNIALSVGGFVGWVDDLAVSCDVRSTQVPNTTNYVIPPPPTLPPMPPPPPVPSPPPPPPRDNRFPPLVPDAATLAVMTADSSCGLSGAAVAASGSGLPLVFFLAGQPSSTVMTPTSATYPAGLSVGVSATPWASAAAGSSVPPSGCSLRVESAAVVNGNSGVSWKVPKALLQPAIDANAFTIEAKVYPEVWRVGYSKWNADVLGSQCNWDSAFKVTHNIWNGMTVQLSTPAASTTGAFSGTLSTDAAVQGALTPGFWHHVALAANSTACVVSVDGREVVAGKCEAKKLIWQTFTTIYVGGFVGWVDEVQVSAAARKTQVPLAA